MRKPRHGRRGRVRLLVLADGQDDAGSGVPQRRGRDPGEDPGHPQQVHRRGDGRLGGEIGAEEADPEEEQEADQRHEGDRESYVAMKDRRDRHERDGNDQRDRVPADRVGCEVLVLRTQGEQQVQPE